MNKSTLANGLTIAIALFALTACQPETAKPLTAEEKIVAKDDHVRQMLATAADISKPHIVVKENHPERIKNDLSKNSIIFDGSSEEAFRAGLEEFQSVANPAEISGLNSALNYLKVFDLSARGNTAKLYHQLDGMTAEQIVQRANQIKQR